MQVILTEKEYNDLKKKAETPDHDTLNKQKEEIQRLKDELKVFTTRYKLSDIKLHSDDMFLAPFDLVRLEYNMEDLPPFMRDDILRTSHAQQKR